MIAGEGAPLVSEWSLSRHPETRVTVVSDAELGHAQSRGLSLEALRGQFGRLGNTPYELADLALESNGAPFAPASLLNQVRREAVERLQTLQAGLHPPAVNDPSAAVRAMRATPGGAAAPGAAELHLLVAHARANGGGD